MIDVAERVKRTVAQTLLLQAPAENLLESSRLDDLMAQGMDSVNLVGILAAMEEEFELEFAQDRFRSDSILTIGDLVALVRAAQLNE